MDFQYLNEISKTFKGFEDNPRSIYKVVNSINKENLKEVYDYYLNKEKHYKINKVIAARKILVKELINGIKLDDDIVNKATNKIQKEAKRNNYDKDIFHSWKPNWRILYPIYYFNKRQIVIKSLKMFAERLMKDLNILDIASVTINDFNGSQHFGNTGCWFAIYNNTHSSQRTALQLFFLLRNGVVKYGLYDYVNKNEDKIVIRKVKDISYEIILKEFRKYIDDIKKDKSKKKTSGRVKATRIGNQTVNVDGYFRNPINSTFVEQKHKKIQEIYLKSLQNNYGENNVKLEEDFIDIKVETNDTIYLYEIKTNDKAIYCIRDAIGQLLLYASRLKSKTKKQINLIVVGLGEDNIDSKEFNKYLLENFNFNFEYKYHKYE